MPDHVPLIIPGASPQSDRLEVHAPFDGRLIATLDTAGHDAVNIALDTATALFRDRDGWLPAEQRIGILERVVALMTTQVEDLAIEAAREGGKPLMDSRVEVHRAIDGVRNCADLIRQQGGQVIPMNVNPGSSGRLAFTRREPIGVVVSVSAFNHPLNLIVHQVAPAVAAGCPVIVKPAEDTPLSCFRFVRLLQEAGLPEGWCQALVVHDLQVASKLVTDSRVAFFSFIGSARVGWKLRAGLAPGTRCALEHGGVAPVIVAADADLDDALPLLAKGGLYHAGQVCVSVQRVFAQQAVARQVAEGLATLGGAYSVGDPTLEGTEVGPLIRPREVDRVETWVNEAVARGTEVLAGGARLSKTCYAPTILFGPPPDSKVSTLEVFGPVICVYPYDQLDEAIARANSLPYAFQASIFTRDLDTALRASSRLDASAVMVNDHTAFRVDWMPFAGLRESGLGVGGIPYTFRDMQIEKLTVVRSSELC